MRGVVLKEISSNLTDNQTDRRRLLLNLGVLLFITFLFVDIVNRLNGSRTNL